MHDGLIPPHGGKLIDLMVRPDEAGKLADEAAGLPSWALSPRQLCDLELLLSGGFSPLTGFMGRADHESICSRMRLESGLLWPIPITLDVPRVLARDLDAGSSLTLRDPAGAPLAVLRVRDVWEPDRKKEGRLVYGTGNPEHPGVAHLLQHTNSWCIGGRLEGLETPAHYDFREMRLTPGELRAEFNRLGWRRVVAFQTRNPMHRAHQELTLRASKEVQANLLIHPVVGMTRPGDLDHYTRVRCYQALLQRYPAQTVKLSLLPLAMRMAGPREAVWHAIIRKNHGCTHFIVGRDHAGPGVDSSGKPFYGPYDAQELMEKFREELGVTMVPFRNLVYLEDRDIYVPDSEVPEGSHALTLSGTDLRRRLAEGRDLPSWFTFPEVALELRRRHPPRHSQGLTIFLSGLPKSGKSTIANVLRVKFLEIGGRPVTLLDGDIVRRNLSSELGFSREHRDINIRRIGFVASEITKNGGIAICAPIAPYDDVRREIRASIEAVGGFLLIHVSTPIEVCERRDNEGIFAKARAGEIRDFTGISDPYEPPEDAAMAIDTTDMSPEEAAQEIFLLLEREGYVAARV